MNPAPSVIFDTLVGLVVRTALVFSAFLLFAGHNAPGGGFVGGLIAGSGLVLWYVDRGSRAIRQLVRLSPLQLMGAGLAVAALTGVGGWVWGIEFLDATAWKLKIVVFGEVKLTTALIFDIGVYLVVVGLAAAILEALGREGAER